MITIYAGSTRQHVAAQDAAVTIAHWKAVGNESATRRSSPSRSDPAICWPCAGRAIGPRWRKGDQRVTDA
jgi:hypothetical protein